MMVLDMGMKPHKMAASREPNFKSFVIRKKTEYSLRFPFLTERQILAKLRRVWECQKSSAASRSRKMEPGKRQELLQCMQIVFSGCAQPFLTIIFSMPNLGA